jgi:hypothetical protein
MAYATREDLSASLATSEADVPDDGEADRLLAYAALAIDRALGVPVPEDGGPGLDPGSLTAGQAERLKLASLRHVEWAILTGRSFQAGDGEFLPATLTLAVPPLRRVPDQVLEPLGGSGLVRRSGTISPEPPVAA